MESEFEGLQTVNMGESGIKSELQKEDPHYIDQILSLAKEKTQIENVELSEGNTKNKLRMEAFNNLSSNMKEALSQIGEIFRNTKAPWAIHGSTSLVLEAETTKKPNDIDIAFGDIDQEVILSNFRALQEQGLARYVEPKEMADLDGRKNGCTRIFAELRTGAGTPENPHVWVDIEAFAQNIDPNEKANGRTNIGLDPMTITKYTDETNLDLYFADREENLRFYLQTAAIELQKYHIDNAFKEGGDKNKFPQRLNNIIAIIKRREREQFEEEIKKGTKTELDRPKTEDVTDENIFELEKEFRLHNDDKKIFAKFGAETGSKLDPIDVVFKKFIQFMRSRSENEGKHEGFVNQKGTNREEAVDTLTQENLIDMTSVTSAHKKLMSLESNIKKLAEDCKEGCSEDKKEIIIKIKETILSDIRKLSPEIEGIREKYINYLGDINYRDNRDFIPFIAIKETLESYIEPALKLAKEMKTQVETITF